MNFLHVVLVILLGAVVSGLLTFLEIPFLKNHQFKQYIQEYADVIDVAAAYPCVFDIVCTPSIPDTI